MHPTAPLRAWSQVLLLGDIAPTVHLPVGDAEEPLLRHLLLQGS